MWQHHGAPADTNYEGHSSEPLQSHFPGHELEHQSIAHNQKKPDTGLTQDPKQHLQEDDYADQDHHEIQAGMSKHHCTDLLFLAIFLLAVAGLGGLVRYGSEQGDIRRLFRGYNFTGYLCGVDAPDKPLLYWCQKPVPGGITINTLPVLDLRHPICVQSCPTSVVTNHTCFSRVERTMKQQPQPLASGGGFVFEETNRYIFAQVPDYKSRPFLGRYCLPEDTAIMSQLMKALNKHTMTRALMDVSQLASAWVPLTCAAILAFILGYVYLFLLEKFATCLVHTAVVLVIVLSICTGGYLIISQFTGGIDGIPNTGDSKLNWIAGVGLLVLALAFGCFAFCAHDQIEVAVGCVQAAADCIFEMPSLLLEPLISLLVKLILFVLLTSGFMLLASVGKVRTMTLEQFTSTYETIPGGKVSGVFRTFQYHENQYWYMAYYIFVSIWILSMLTALSQFVMAYSVQLWYFTPCQSNDRKVGVPKCPLVRGYFIGSCYHLGSLAFGSLIVTVLYIVRALLGALAHAADHEGNHALACLAKCLMCCVTCYERCIEFLNKNAYMDIAINSTTFCTAAQNALHVISSEIAAISLLNGACWVFKIAGYALITSTGTFLVWTMVRSLWWFNSVHSQYYIHDPIAVCAVAGVICFLVAVGFMLVFDTVADTILYCYATEEMRKQRGLLPKDVQYAPSLLAHLIAEHSEDSHAESSSMSPWESLMRSHHDTGQQVMSPHPAAGQLAQNAPAASPHPSGWGDHMLHG